MGTRDVLNDIKLIVTCVSCLRKTVTNDDEHNFPIQEEVETVNRTDEGGSAVHCCLAFGSSGENQGICHYGPLSGRVNERAMARLSHINSSSSKPAWNRFSDTRKEKSLFEFLAHASDASSVTT